MRYLAIDRRLRQTPFPSLLDIKNYVESNIDYKVSIRTIQLDIQEMRYSTGLNFNAPIKTRNHGKYGGNIYYYSVKSWCLIKRIKHIQEGLLLINNR